MVLARFASKLKQRARHPDPPTVSVLYPPSDTERHPLGNTVPCVIMFNPKLPYMFGSPASIELLIPDKERSN